MAKLQTINNVAQAVSIFRRTGQVTVQTNSSALRQLIGIVITQRVTSDFHEIPMGNRVHFMRHPDTRNAPLLKPDFR